MDCHLHHASGARATIAQAGAELRALHLGGRDLLWDAGPLWPRCAPLLFPIVGALAGDTLRHRGVNYTLPKHGFARDLNFEAETLTTTACTLSLTECPATLVAYPFPFRLSVTYTLAATSLRMDLALANPGPQPLPASLGLHPAFRWPLAPGLPKAAHRLVFAAPEPGPLRRINAQGLLTEVAHPTPIADRILPLREALFEADALLFLEPQSRALRFEVPDGPTLSLTWEGFPHLGVWTKPDLGPGFLCIEPWDGYASPAHWDGEFSQKPGSFVLAPGTERKWSLTVSVKD